jgi:flagellar biosynthesis protein FlgN
MSISSLFNQDAVLLNKLVSLLVHEQSALVNMDIDEMEQILDDKSQLIQQITTATKIRHQALAKSGFDANENGMATWVRATSHKQTNADWHVFQQQLAKAKELNRVNGQVINQHFKRNQQTINQLQGKAANANGSMYGPNGQTALYNHTRSMLSV